MTKLVRSIAPLCVVVALGACGGSSYKGLSKAEYVKQANAMCKTANDTVDAAGSSLSKNPTDQQIATLFVDKVVPISDKLLDDLSALHPPKDDRDQVKTLLDEAKAAYATLAHDFKHDPSTALRESDSVFKKANADATAYGLTVCGS